MYSFVFVSHGDLGESLVRTAASIMKEDFTGRYEIFSIDYSMLAEMDHIKDLLEKAVARFTRGGYRVVIFVDIFGGSPSNVSFALVKREDIDVIAGANLPMVVYAFEHRNDEVPLAQMVEGILQAGRENLVSAKKLLEKKGGKPHD